MKGQQIYENTFIAIVFFAIFILVFVAQLYLIIKFRNIHQGRLEEIDERVKESERLVRSQVKVNNEVIKMMNTINKIVNTKN